MKTKIYFHLTYSLLLFFIFFNTELLSQNPYNLNVNRISLPLDNKGVLADVDIGGTSGGYLDGKQFLYSGGFFLSGKVGDSLWAKL